MKDKILDQLEKNPDLPPLPEITFRIQQMIRDPKTSARSIAKLIEVDPVLAGRILKLANSAFYSRSATSITTLPVAITKIGLNMIVKLVYSLKITTLFKDSLIVDSKIFWKHCLAVAILTQSLCRRTNATLEEQDIAYLGGLMHDIGIMVFGHSIPGEYESFLKKIQETEQPLEKLEAETFGLDHAELGALFIEKYWEVDERIVHAVRTHHQPVEGRDKALLCSDLVNISNSICNNFDIINGISAYPEILRDTSWDGIGLSLADIETIMEDIETVHDQAKELINQTA